MPPLDARSAPTQLHSEMTPDEPATHRSSALAHRLQAALGDAYAVERELGAGGMAVVFLVRDLSLKRKLAVKVVSPDLISSAIVLERFKREAETVAQLSHPNIVPLHFIGQKDDLFYLAMGFVDGGALDTRISSVDGQQMPFTDVRRAMSEVASALTHAHKHGVIHRDIKPQNVLVDSDTGRCLVTDFGIARTAESPSLTATGLLIGTPAYLAPEQVIGEPSDHRADIFALGVMSYEMVTGRQPFDAPTPTAVLMKRLGQPAEPVGNRRANVPRDLQDAITGCLAPDPAERFQHAADVVHTLDGGASVGRYAIAPFAIRSRRKTRQRRALIVGGLAVGVGAGAFSVRGLIRASPLLATAAVDSGMVLIPAGEYLIGSDSGNGRSRPAHRLRLASFGIETHEVTNGEFSAFAESTKSPVTWNGPMPGVSLPVTRVQWDEATKYCRWKHPVGGDLPSEDQWEAAARGRDGRLYPWGSSFELAAANTAASGRNAPAPVGSFPRGATSAGVHDLIGNVWEWTRSTMQSYPGGAAMPDSLRRYYVIRGGAHNSATAIATSWFRGFNRPATSRDDLAFTGFRCVMPAR